MDSFFCTPRNSLIPASNSRPNIMAAQMEARRLNAKQTMTELKVLFMGIVEALSFYYTALLGITAEHVSFFNSENISPRELDDFFMEMEFLHRQLKSCQQGWCSGYNLILLLKNGSNIELPSLNAHSSG